MKEIHPVLAGKAAVCTLVAACCSVFCTVQAETVANKTEVMSFAFRDGDVHHRKVLREDGLIIAEHDMIMGKDARDNQRQTRGLSNFAYGKPWPNGVVPYRIGASLNEATKRKIQEAVAHWNSFEAITLVERTVSNASAYPHYIDFIYDNRCASWVGFQADGPQAIYTGDRCSTGTIIHEIGHALGLLHEHTRSDRDQYVQIHWDRIDPGMEVNFEVMEGNILLGDYDYGSIMHYGKYFFSRNGMPTIQPLRAAEAEIGQRIQTSEGDREAIAQLYQTNLTLTAINEPESTGQNEVSMTLQVTNNTDNGANTLSISLPVPTDATLLSYQSSSWSCYQASTETLKCDSFVLAGNSSSTVTLNLGGISSASDLNFEPTLSSRTRDTTKSDTLDIISTDSDDSLLANESKDDTIEISQINSKTGDNELNYNAEPQLASAVDAGSGSADWGLIAALFGLLGLNVRRRQSEQLIG